MLSGLGLPMIALLAVFGVVLDLILGEVNRWHPLVGFGRVANVIERTFNRGRYKYARGALAWGVAVLPFVLIGYWLIDGLTKFDAIAGAVLHVVLLYLCLGLRSLYDHTAPIAQALQKNDLVTARAMTGRIVSRDTSQADASDLAKASVESLLENGNDAVFGTLFWFIVAGGPGAMLFRLANTLDAMWGYRTSRFLAFGCVAARLDDALNWIPARLTALSYALLGNTKLAWQCWRTQSPTWESPNAGPVMAAGAGSLGLALGGDAIYHGILESRPPLGRGCPPAPSDIRRAWHLVFGTTALWVGMIILAVIIQWCLQRMRHA